MPLTLEPGGRIPFILDTDKHKPNPPTFYFKAQSARQAIALEQQLKIDALAGVADKVAHIKSVLSGVLVGWENMGTDFGIDDLDNVLTIQELWELAFGVLSGQHVSPDEKKNSSNGIAANG